MKSNQTEVDVHDENLDAHKQGDCQNLNAAMRGVAKALYRISEDVEIIGFADGYKGHL